MASIALVSLLAIGCGANAPDTRAEGRSLEMEAGQARAAMVQADPSLASVLDQAAGYVVFPRVREGAFVVGGTGGQGVVYENGRPIGYASLGGGSVGLQAGGQGYTELMVLDQAALNRLKADDVDLTADASATIVRSGAARQAHFEDGIAVFIHDESGAMVEASVGGQRIEFTPRS